MLNLESRMEILGITVFQDTDAAEQFYYLPGQPHIAREGGEPLFDLFTYNRGGASGTTLSGGFLNMAVETGIGTLKDRIESQLKERFGDNVTLASVPLTKGTVRVIALGEDSDALKGGVASETTADGQPVVSSGPRFIQNILGAGTPSLDAANRAIFSFSLSEEGSAFFLGALSGSVTARPVGVIYELEYVGLLPAYDLEITIDFKSVYNYMQTRFSLNTLFFKTEVDNILEQLKRNQSIKIRETARTLELSTPEAVRERQNHIDQVVKDLATGALFNPALTPGQPKTQPTTLSAADAAAAAGQPPALAALRNGIAPAVAAGLSEVYRNQAGPQAAASGNAGAAQPSGTPAAGGQPAAGGGNTATDLWNRLGRPQAAFALKSLRQEEQRTITYSLSQVTAQKQTFAPQSFIQFLASPAELRRHIQAIDLNHPFFQRINIDVSAAGVDFAAEGLTQMTVQLRYGTRPDGTKPKDSVESILRSADDKADFTFFVDKALTQSYEYKLIADYRTDFGIGLKAPRLETDWVSTEDRSLRVHPSVLGRVRSVTVQLAPNLPSDVSQADVRLHYVSSANGVDDAVTLHLKPGDPAQTVAIRLADPADTYTAETSLFFADGTRQDLPAQTLPDPDANLDGSVVVVSAPRANRLDGDVILQDPLGELQSALVDLKTEQGSSLLDSRSLELTQPLKPERFSIRLPQPTPLPVLSFRERRLFKDGGLEEFPWKESPSANVRVGIPAERVKDVVVEYIGPDLSDMGVSALVVDLEYTDPKGDPLFQQSTSILIRDDVATQRQEWRIRLPDALARTYQWKLTVMMDDGSENSTEFTEDTRDHLLLRMPQF